MEYLLGDILSSVIGRIRVDRSSMGFSYLLNPCFGPDELGLCLGLLRMDVGLALSPSRYWAGGWIFGLFIYPYQILFKIRYKNKYLGIYGT